MGHNEYKIDGLTVRRYDSRREMAAAAAAYTASLIQALLEKQEEVNITFAAAPSQADMLAALAQADVAFDRVNAFHMDEYFTLPEHAPARFGRWLDRHFFGLVPLKRVHYLGRGSDAPAECRRYSALLEQYPTDITLMGIGENGHIAFNDPHEADFDDPRLVRRATLDEICRTQQVRDGTFPNLDAVPLEALTLTIPALLRAKHAVCTVPGVNKASAVKHALFGPVAASCPASVMRSYDNCTLFCDRDSGVSLPEQPY